MLYCVVTADAIGQDHVALGEVDMIEVPYVPFRMLLYLVVILRSKAYILCCLKKDQIVLPFRSNVLIRVAGGVSHSMYLQVLLPQE